MYAVIQTGGKQYRVTEGEILRVELLDKEPKEAIIFDRVLLIDNEGATVSAEVICHDRRKKVLIFKKKRTTTYQRTNGHRQGFTEVRIKGIQA